MQRKIHNKTLFVAALSVYLGLLIVGAPPQVFAQRAVAKKVQQESFDNRTGTIQNRRETAASNDLLHLHKLLAESNFPFHFIYQIEYSGEQITRKQIILAEGEKEIIDSFHKAISEIYSQSGLIADNLSISSVLYDVRVNKAEFAYDVTYNFKESEQAKFFADQYKAIFDFVKADKIEKGQEKVYSSSFTTVDVKNNQVFIITRLPRAALDSRIKADEKAN